MLKANENSNSQLARQYIRESAASWLRGVIYWLGYISGKNKMESLRCDELEYRWSIGYGINLYIQPLSRGSKYTRYDMCVYESFGQRPFEYKWPHEININDYHSEIENLIKEFLPGIHSGNTWAVCEMQEAENCLGRDNHKSICNNIEGKKTCSECEDWYSKQLTKEYYGFVYLIGNQERGLYKIGASNKPKSRYKAIKTELPFKIEIIHQIGTDDMRRAEKCLHVWFSKKRTHGEWFTLSPEDIQLLLEIAEFERGQFKDKFGNSINAHMNST